MRTTPIPNPLPGPSPRIRSWRVSRASHKAPRPPKPHNLSHEPLLQDTRDLLSFFSFRAHLLGGGRRPPERTRLNSAVRHQLGSRFVLPWGSTDDSGGPGRDHSSIRARWLMRTTSLSLGSEGPEPGEAGGPITYSAPLGGTRPFSGTPRVSTPAPELLVIDAFLQHAVQAQHQLAPPPPLLHGASSAPASGGRTVPGLLRVARHSRRLPPAGIAAGGCPAWRCGRSAWCRRWNARWGPARSRRR